METSFRELQSKEVVSLGDGRKLGRIVDLNFCFPEGRVTAIVVPGERCGLLKPAAEVVIDFCQIQKIGEDVILIREKRTPPPPPGKPNRGRRYCDEDCEE